MKKTLRGKRHIRAARSVVIGRDNKKVRKINRELRAMNWFVKVRMPQIIKNAYESIIKFSKVIASVGVSLDLKSIYELAEDGKMTEVQKEILKTIVRNNELSKTKSTT